MQGAGFCVNVEGDSVGARASVVEFEPRQGVTALEALVPIAELGL